MAVSTSNSDKSLPPGVKTLTGGLANKNWIEVGAPKKNSPIMKQAAQSKAAKEAAAKAARPYKTSGSGRPLGLLGSADAMERRRIAMGKPVYGTDQTPPVDESILDGLGIDGGGGGGGGGRAYSDAQVAATEAKLRALYSRYAQDILDQQANINTNYATGATNLGSIYDTAVGNVNKSYDAARAEQTRQLLALGMTEQTPVQSFGNQTGDVGSFERLRAAVLAQNEASRNNAITNQRLASEAAQREGAQQIAQTVAQMQSAMTSGGGGGGSSSGGLSAKDYATLKLREMEMKQNAEIAAAKIAASNQPKAAGPDMQAILDQVAGTKGLTTEQYNMARLLKG
jgi:hypothetical protein